MISCFIIYYGETEVLKIGLLISPEVYCLDEPPNSKNDCYWNLYLVALTPKVIMQPSQMYLHHYLLNPL